MKADDVQLREVLFEFQRVGNALKVSAIDARTGTEISIVGHPRSSQETLKNTAIQKLKYVIAKNMTAQGH